MGSRFLVIALGVGVLATTGCYYRHRYAYGYGYYGAYSYQPTAQVQAQPEGQVQAQPPPEGQPPQGQPGQPQPQGVQVTASVSGEGITGSDGTRGWRVVVQAPQQEFQHLGQVAAKLNCHIEGSTSTELRAVCNPNVHILVRFDQQHVYKLCAPNTDPNACATVWASFGN